MYLKHTSNWINYRYLKFNPIRDFDLKIFHLSRDICNSIYNSIKISQFNSIARWGLNVTVVSHNGKQIHPWPHQKLKNGTAHKTLKYTLSEGSECTCQVLPPTGRVQDRRPHHHMSTSLQVCTYINISQCTAVKVRIVRQKMYRNIYHTIFYEIIIKPCTSNEIIPLIIADFPCSVILAYCIVTPISQYVLYRSWAYRVKKNRVSQISRTPIWILKARNG